MAAYLFAGLAFLVICYSCFLARYRKGEADVNIWCNRVSRASKSLDDYKNPFDVDVE